MLSTRERIDIGRALRKSFPRSELGRLSEFDRDPLGILNMQNAHRVQELIPLRSERMSQSPFAFYRGTASIMAADFAEDAHTGVRVGSCGDAHVANFGFYASPQRRLVFDLNDFDEAAFAPWEWDLKRLIASITIAGQESGRDERVIETAVLDAVVAYAMAIKGATEMSPLARYFLIFDVEGVTLRNKQASKLLNDAIEDAEKRTGLRAVKRLTTADDEGNLRFVESPPVMTRLEVGEAWNVQHHIQAYIESAGADIAQLSRHYRIVDFARRVVGVGSVGTRCSLALLQDGDGGALILQSKESNLSVLQQFGGIEQPAELTRLIESDGEGARVVALQRILQAVSDPFLGHIQLGGSDLYIRQFHDMKGGIETDTLDDGSFDLYGKACAVVLARAHSQSPHVGTIAGYVGAGKALGKALLPWTFAYADRSRADFEAFVASTSTSTA